MVLTFYGEDRELCLAHEATTNKGSAVTSMIIMHFKTWYWRIKNNRSIESNGYRISTCPHRLWYRVPSIFSFLSVESSRIWQLVTLRILRILRRESKSLGHFGIVCGFDSRCGRRQNFQNYFQLTREWLSFEPLKNVILESCLRYTPHTNRKVLIFWAT